VDCASSVPSHLIPYGYQRIKGTLGSTLDQRCKSELQAAARAGGPPTLSDSAICVMVTCPCPL
jgi:hypothetical protein